MNIHLSDPQNRVFFAPGLPKTPKIFSARAFGARETLDIFLVGEARAKNHSFERAVFIERAFAHTFGTSDG